MSYCIIVKVSLLMNPVLLQCDKNKIPSVCKGLSANTRPAQCLHTLWQTGGPFTPPYPPSHRSLLKSKHRLWSRLLLFPPWPQNERAHSPFPASLVHSDTLRHISFPAISLTHAWTDGCNSFHFLPFFRSVCGTRCCSPGHTFIRSFSSSSARGARRRSQWDWRLSLWVHSVVGGWGLLQLDTHESHVSHMHTLTTHTVSREPRLAWLQCVKRSWMTAERDDRLAGEYTELSVGATLTWKHCPVNEQRLENNSQCFVYIKNTLSAQERFRTSPCRWMLDFVCLEKLQRLNNIWLQS